MKTKEADLFKDEDNKKFYFVANGGTQTIALVREENKEIIFEVDYKNAYKVTDLLEKAINFLDEDEE